MPFIIYNFWCNAKYLRAHTVQRLATLYIFYLYISQYKPFIKRHELCFSHFLSHSLKKNGVFERRRVTERKRGERCTQCFCKSLITCLKCCFDTYFPVKSPKIARPITHGTCDSLMENAMYRQQKNDLKLKD